MNKQTDNNGAAVFPRTVSAVRLSHAYIVGSDRDAAALACAAVCSGVHADKPCGVCRHCDKALRGIHPDIRVIDLLPEKREITVDQIRAVKEDAIVMPNEADKKVYIISNADAMNKAAQNALLTLLEEPPVHVMLILSAGNAAQLLKTVRSRCVELKSVTDCDDTDSQGMVIAEEFFAALQSGGAGLMEFSFRLDKLDRIGLSGFIDSALVLLAQQERAAVSTGSGEALSVLLKVESALLKAAEYSAVNVSAVHISGFLCAELFYAKQ